MNQPAGQQLPGVSINSLLIACVFLGFLALRLFSWNNVLIYADSDSTGLLTVTQWFLALDLQALINMSPDYTPFYPAVSALFSAFTGDSESGARLGSLAMSCVAFFALIGIGRKIAGPFEITVGLALLAFSPFMVRFSYSILTEPTYVATVYLGLLLFWSRLTDLRLQNALLLGIIYALCFLNRIEGLLFLVAIPVLQYAHYLYTRGEYYDLRSLARWSGVYIVTFILLISPQVWRVSELMGSPSLNGRQTWTMVLSSDGRSYEEAIYGLDYNPGQTNLHFLKANPEARAKYVVETGLGELVVSNIKLVYHNLRDLFGWSLSRLIGPYGLALFVIGLLVLYHRRLFFEIFLIGAFIVIGLAAPLLHNVAVRHIAVIGPLMMLVQGIGIVAIAEQAVSFFKLRRVNSEMLAILAVGVLFLASAKPLYNELRYPQGSRSAYAKSELARPIAIVQQLAQEELGRPANIVARKGYLSFYTDSPSISLPYTDYEGLVRYAELNEVDLLFLERARLSDHPFMEEFYSDAETPEFELLFKDTLRRRWDIRLYRFRPTGG